MDSETLKTELERNHDKSFAWARVCCCKYHQDPEDVLQTVYFKVLSGKARFDERSSFKTWLLAVIRNTALDGARKCARTRFEPLSDVHLEAPSLGSGPDDAAQQRETAHGVKAALAMLPPRQEEILRLVFYHGLSFSEAALVMNTSIGTVRVHYTRGKQQLKRYFHKEANAHERAGY